MAIHWQFAGEKNYRVLFCDSSHMSVGQIKKKITEFGCLTHSFIRLLDPTTEEEWKDDKEWLPRGTTVMAERLPLPKQKKVQVKKEDPLPVPSNASASEVLREVIASSHISNSTATEAEKIKTVLKHSTEGFDPSNFDRVRSTTAPLPPDYQCFRCNQKGHHIKDCPTNNMKIKRSTGIPKSFMVPASADQKGALLSSSGEFAIPKIDLQVYTNNDTEQKPQQMESDEYLEDNEKKKEDIPHELRCKFENCKNLILDDAVFSPCCADAFCDLCLRCEILESGECPSCHEKGIEVEHIIPVLRLRKLVKRFLASRPSNMQTEPIGDSTSTDSSYSDKENIETNVTDKIEATETADDAELNKIASEPIDDLPVESSSSPVTHVQPYSDNSNTVIENSSQEKMLDSPLAGVSKEEDNSREVTNAIITAKEEDEKEEKLKSDESKAFTNYKAHECNNDKSLSPEIDEKEKDDRHESNDEEERDEAHESPSNQDEENFKDSRADSKDHVLDFEDAKIYPSPAVIGNVIRPLIANVPCPVLTHRFPSYPPPSRPLMPGPPIATSHRPPFRLPFMPQVPFMPHPGFPPQFGIMPPRYNFSGDVRGPMSGYDARG